jgi:hypothetical protein
MLHANAVLHAPLSSQLGLRVTTTSLILEAFQIENVVQGYVESTTTMPDRTLTLHEEGLCRSALSGGPGPTLDYTVRVDGTGRVLAWLSDFGEASMFENATRHDWRILRFSNGEWSGHFKTAQDALLFL